MGIEAGADSSAADGKIVETVESDGHAPAVAVKHIDVAGKFLTERERRGILEMSAPDFYDVGELFGFGVERVAKILQRGEQTARGFRGSGNVHGGGKSVVGGLRHVHVIIWVDRFLAAHLASGN